MGWEEYSPFKGVLENAMRRAGDGEALMIDKATFDDARAKIIAKLYDDVEGGCSEWLAEQLNLDARIARRVIVRLETEEEVFIYFEKKKVGMEARWRLTSDAWAREAARRAEAQPVSVD